MIHNKKCIEGTLTFVISSLYFAFVSWQSWKCMSKYRENPQGTKLSLQNTALTNQFPVITICKDPKALDLHQVNDFDQLKKCKFRYHINEMI